MDIITSKSNENVKFIKSLNDKKFRYNNRSFYLEGIKVIDEVLKLDRAINIKFIAYSKDILENLNGGNEILIKIFEYSKKTNLKILEFKKEIFEYMTDTITPQGILTVLEMPNYNINDLLKENSSNILILDKVQDSGNIGTIIRTADAFGVNLVLCTEGTTDIYSPKVLRSTMGSILRVKVLYIKENYKEILENIRKSKIKIIGTSLNTNKYIKDIDFKGKYAFIVGNEANGVSEEINNLCDEFIKIPMTNSAESLNVGIATGIILYEQFNNK